MIQQDPKNPPTGQTNEPRPHGPPSHGADETAGGADSSPLENMSSDERHSYYEEAIRSDKTK